MEWIAAEQLIVGACTQQHMGIIIELDVEIQRSRIVYLADYESLEELGILSDAALCQQNCDPLLLARRAVLEQRNQHPGAVYTTAPHDIYA